MGHDSRVSSRCARAIGLGLVAGMRSQFPLALLALAASRDSFAAASEGLLSLLRSPIVRRGLAVLTVGEIVGDKLPFTPSRLDPGPLFGRVLFGGLAGAAMVGESRQTRVLGAALGAGGAVLGARVGYRARVALGRSTGVPDPVWGAVEDAVAVALGVGVLHLRMLHPPRTNGAQRQPADDG